MSNRSFILTNFTSGEVSPKLAGRTDIDQYFNSALTIENALVSHYGSVYRRPGTKYVASVKTAADTTRLIPFEFSTSQAYILEFGDLYMRVYKDSGVVLDGATAYEIVSPWTKEQIMDVQYSQDADVMYMTHPNVAPYKLSRTGHTAWTLTKVTFTGGPFLTANTSANTMQASSLTKGDTDKTLTAAGGHTPFNAGHVGSIWSVGDEVATVQGYVTCTAYVSTTVLTVTITTTLSTTAATATWAEGAWSDVRGFPRAVTFYEQRLAFGGSEEKPQTVWLSVSQVYEGFQAGADDAEALIYTLASAQVNTIQWLNAGRVLTIGTAGAVFTMSTGASNSEPLTPSNVVVRREVTYGAYDIQPAQIGNHIYFIQRNTRTLREFFYKFDNDAYEAVDATLLADHISESGLVGLEFQQSPDQLIWLTRTDGQVAVLTKQITQKVNALSRQVLGGSFGTGDAVVESVAIIPNGEEDQVWFIVKRTINGSTVRYVEHMMTADWGSDTTDMFFVDCGLTYDSTAATVISGLDHLEGATVAVFADGAPRNDKTVSSGSITLSRSASKVHIGFSYTTTLKTQNVEMGGQTGSTQGYYKSINKVTARLYKTIGGKMGKVASQDNLIFENTSMDLAPVLYTGDKQMLFNKGFSKEAYVVIKQEQPLPLHVLAIILQTEVSN